ncbi:MAG: phosphatase PAP2 family protein [Thermoanaerobaculia bacterium]|nr:phosphatase PAP2 family protein [Thermoanaerobaculia bacterium]
MFRKRSESRRKRKRIRTAKRRTFLPLAIGTSGGVILATAAFVFFRHQAKQVVTGRADTFDSTIMDLVHSGHSDRMDKVMRSATFLGEHVAIGAAAYITAMTMMKRDRHHDAWTVLISTGGAMVLNTALKGIFQRQRPLEKLRMIKLPRSHSFPSGHSLLSAATYPIVAHHLVHARSISTQIATQISASIIILSVGYSRIYFGVHFPSDVLGGFAAGLGWLGLTSLSHGFVDREVASNWLKEGRQLP